MCNLFAAVCDLWGKMEARGLRWDDRDGDGMLI